MSEASKEASRKYYNIHKKKLIADMKQYRLDNPEKCKAIQRAYYERNKERLLEKRKNKGNDAAEFREYIRQLIKDYEEENRTGTD